MAGGGLVAVTWWDVGAVFCSQESKDAMRQSLECKLIRGRGTCKIQNKDVDLHKCRIRMLPLHGNHKITHSIVVHSAHEATVTVRMGLRTGKVLLQADIDPSKPPLRRPAVRRSSCNCGR